MKIRAGDGCGQLGFPEMLSTPLFYMANPGDRLILTDKAYKFNVATYRPEIDPNWLYTYTYAPDQIWAIYNKDLSGDSYRVDDYVFVEQVYFRICLRKTDDSLFDGSEDIDRIIKFEHTVLESSPAKWLTDGVVRVSTRVKKLRTDGDMVFIVMTDSHFNVNGTWDDTKTGVRLLCEDLSPDAIIHLGDFTDGMVTADAMRFYVKNILSDLKNCDVPVYVTLGNHDCNYFRKNPERLSETEQRELYLDGRETCYYVDYPDLRLIFLDSFNPEETLRYGYSDECVEWLDKMLSDIAEENSALIFSHLPPLTRLQYWAKELRGEARLVNVVGKHKPKIIAWINGHNHADMLDNEEGFPIISIANAKCEAFLERKPEGFITPERRLGDVSQELFDVLIVNAKKRRAHFVRFGAGSDRIIKDRRVVFDNAM